MKFYLFAFWVAAALTPAQAKTVCECGIVSNGSWRYSEALTANTCRIVRSTMDSGHWPGCIVSDKDEFLRECKDGTRVRGQCTDDENYWK
ncbi:hypothetical protein LZ30DRAFT_333662 [Colletotrichum cereale]|nr:hypothetical protein LZ30DRAFT_333662 [Colletotrichum cereale]